jgi:hypothetical protein
MLKQIILASSSTTNPSQKCCHDKKNDSRAKHPCGDNQGGKKQDFNHGKGPSKKVGKLPPLQPKP